MSRIGKLPIKVPSDIAVRIDGNVVIITKGSVEKRYGFDKVKIVFENNEIKVLKKNPKDKVANFLGLHRSNLNNIIKGLTDGYTITLETKGVGYKASVVDGFLILNLGFSHDIAYEIPKGTEIKTAKPNLIIIKSDDKQKIGQTAREIIDFRPTEPYKGKGIKIQGAWVLRKEGKKK